MFHAIDRLKYEAEQLEHTVTSLALAWNLYHPSIAATIKGPKRAEHLDAVKRAVNKPLDELQWQSLNVLFSECMPDFDLNRLRG